MSLIHQANSNKVGINVSNAKTTTAIIVKAIATADIDLGGMSSVYCIHVCPIHGVNVEAIPTGGTFVLSRDSTTPVVMVAEAIITMGMDLIDLATKVILGANIKATSIITRSMALIIKATTISIAVVSSNCLVMMIMMPY